MLELTWELKINKEGGTGLIDCIDCTYAKLVSVFGVPNVNSDFNDKIDAEWNINFRLGNRLVVATIYNYKDGHNYLGRDGMAVEDITDWHVGGYSPEALDCVRDALDLQ